MVKTSVITINVEINIRIIFNIFALLFVISVKSNVKFKNGTQERTGVVSKFIMKAIIPGKKEINVKGVSALCASLKDFWRDAIDIHRPLIKNE